MLVAVSGNFLNILITFIARTFFIRLLGSEYLGINGLFSNILTILSLAELGVGTAIMYSLYKPLADNDINKTLAIMDLYKNVYRIIGITIISLGLILTPFIEFFIADVPDIKELHLIFILYVVNTAVSYFLSYKRTIIYANQDHYIVSLYQSSLFIIQNALQIIILYTTKNFIIFLVVQICVTILLNILIALKANKLYPFLKNNNVEKVDKETLDNIKKNVGAMIFHKVGSMIVSSTDNILISKLISIITVGLYSNYVLIINAINGLLGQTFSAITASIGNIGATESDEYIHITFKRILFFNFWIYGFCSISLVTLLNPFIELWIGKEMLLDKWVISIAILNFYLSGMRKTVLTFRDALGLYWYDRYKPIAESIINLSVSIILAKLYGLVGIFLGTTISTITTSFWIEPLILYKYGFKEKNSSVLEYFAIVANYTIILGLVLIINYKVAELFNSQTLESFVAKVMICATLPNLLFIIIFRRNEQFKWAVSLINNILNNS